MATNSAKKEQKWKGALIVILLIAVLLIFFLPVFISKHKLIKSIIYTNPCFLNCDKALSPGLSVKGDVFEWEESYNINLDKTVPYRYFTEDLWQITGLNPLIYFEDDQLIAIVYAVDDLNITLQDVVNENGQPTLFAIRKYQGMHGEFWTYVFYYEDGLILTGGTSLKSRKVSDCEIKTTNDLPIQMIYTVPPNATIKDFQYYRHNIHGVGLSLDAWSIPEMQQGENYKGVVTVSPCDN